MSVQRALSGIAQSLKVSSTTVPKSKQARPSPWTAQQLDEARHLLRAILREATYLPDSQARTYVRTHALSRFKDHTPGERSISVLIEKRDVQIKAAQKTLHFLARANDGELWPLRKVLLNAYGRAGKRRHELLRPLIHVPDSLADTDDGTISNKQTMSNVNDGPSTLDHTLGGAERLPQLTDKLYKLLQSQVFAAPPDTTRRNPRRLAPQIPELNAWKRPMPRKRVVNMTKKWYASMLKSALPPLPTDEWERLQDLATGKRVFAGPIGRRTRAKPSHREGFDHIAPLPASIFLVKTNDRESRLSRNHTLTPRYMRRCWAYVFEQCCHMSWDARWDTWQVQWGNRVMKSFARRNNTLPCDS